MVLDALGVRPSSPRPRAISTVAVGVANTPSAPSRKPPARPTDSGEQRPEHPTIGWPLGWTPSRGGVLQTPRSAPRRNRPGVQLTAASSGPNTRRASRWGRPSARHATGAASPAARPAPCAATAGRAHASPPPPADAAGALVHRGVAAALQTVDRLREKLKDVTSRGGVVMGAAGGLLKDSVRARTRPGEPVGWIGGLSTRTKVLISRACPRRAAWARRARRGPAGAARIRRSSRGANQRANMMPAPAGLTEHDVRIRRSTRLRQVCGWPKSGSTDPELACGCREPRHRPDQRRS